VLADGFFEWAKVAGGKQPHYIRLAGGAPFAFAGLWERWDKGESGEPLYTFTIVTTEPNELISRLHHRMPVILKPEDEARWLDPQATKEQLTELIGPFEQAGMEYYPVSTLVNRPQNDKPELILPLEEGGEGNRE
jgi:putative SOS response-associated peptidase YedK